MDGANRLDEPAGNSSVTVPASWSILPDSVPKSKVFNLLSEEAGSIFTTIK